MAHGQADYTKTTSTKVVTAKVDFDLPIILIDRFDSANLLWDGVGVPAGWDVLREAGAAYEGDAGLALRTSAAAAGAGETVDATRHGFTTTTRKISFSSLFRINQTAAFTREIGFGIAGRYNQRLYWAAVRYRPPDEAWDYQNAAGGWTEFMTDIRQTDLIWNRMYLELDQESMQYIAFETADQRAILQGTPIQSNPLPGLDQLYATLHLMNHAAGTRADASFDNVIIKELGS